MTEVRTGTRTHWTKERADELFRLRDEGKNYREIALLVGSSLSRIESFFRWRGLTEEQKAVKRARDSEGWVRRRGRPPGIHTHARRVEPLRPDPAAVADRDYRLSLHPTSLTASLFGDPPPGYSALDKR